MKVTLITTPTHAQCHKISSFSFPTIFRNNSLIRKQGEGRGDGGGGGGGCRKEVMDIYTILVTSKTQSTVSGKHRNGLEEDNESTERREHYNKPQLL